MIFDTKTELSPIRIIKSHIRLEDRDDLLRILENQLKRDSWEENYLSQLIQTVLDSLVLAVNDEIESKVELLKDVIDILNRERLLEVLSLYELNVAVPGNLEYLTGKDLANCATKISEATSHTFNPFRNRSAKNPSVYNPQTLCEQLMHEAHGKAALSKQLAVFMPNGISSNIDSNFVERIYYTFKVNS